MILGGLDNREARVAINQATARAGKVWIDGAIERLDGVARVFDPATGPCYECTMGENDWKMLEARRSCALLSRGEMEQGKVPTTPTTASIIAGIQVQEAIKYLHGLETIAGQGFVFDGTFHQSYLVSYTRKDDCPAHDADQPVESFPGRSDRHASATCSSESARIWGPKPSSNSAATCWLRCIARLAARTSRSSPRWARSPKPRAAARVAASRELRRCFTRSTAATASFST